VAATAKIRCFNGGTTWNLWTSTSNRCPKCDWIQEVYYSRRMADDVADTYNDEQPPLNGGERAGVRRLVGLKGFSVSFPDQDRLLQLADKLLDVESQ